MSTSQDIKDSADSLAYAKNVLETQTPLFAAKNAQVDALVTTELADLASAQAVYDTALAAARVTAGWQTVADAYEDAVLTRDNAISVLQSVIAEYDGI